MSSDGEKKKIGRPRGSKNLARAKHGKLTVEKKKQILKSLERTGNLQASCQAVGVSPQSIYYHRDRDPVFKEKLDIARGKAMLTLESEAHRRAVEGVSEDVYFQGAKVGAKLVYSDRLLEVLMKANDPYRFSNKSQLEINQTISVEDGAKAKLIALLGIKTGDVVEGEYEEIGEDD